MSDEQTDLDIGDTGQVQRRGKDLRLSQQEEGVALSQLLGTAPGRRFVYRTLEACHIFATSFNESVSAMAFAEGERNVGLRLLAAIQQHCPSRYLEMIQEANDDERSATATSPAPSETPAASPSAAPSSTATTTPDGRDATLIGAAPEAAAETKTDTQEPPATPPQIPFDVAKLEFPPELGKPNEATLDKFAEVAKSLNLSQEGAQQLVGLHLDAIKSASEADRQSWSKTIDTWENEIKADPKIGGEKWNDTKASIAKLVLEPSPFATPGLIEALNITGFGSNPAAVRFFAKIASAFGEGRAVTGSAPTQQAPRTAAQALYPTLPSEAR